MIALVVAALALTSAGHAAVPDRCPAEITAAPWPAAEACSVAWCESTWQADAYNPAGPYVGLFQVWTRHVDEPQRLVEPTYNVAAALRLWRASGWDAWARCRP